MMALFNVPYIKVRRNGDGAVRYYWVRPGFKSKRLPDDEGARQDEARALNRRAERGDQQLVKRYDLKPEDDDDRLAHWIKRYLASPHFKGMADNTQRGYRREAERIALAIGTTGIVEMTEQACRRYLSTIPTAPRKLLVKNSLAAILGYAVEEGGTVRNEVRGIRIKGLKHRDQLWMPSEVELFMTGGDILPPADDILATGHMLLLNTAQRIGDVLAMGWNDYDSEFISVTQAKGDKKVSVYCHTDLRRHLDSIKPRRTSTRIVAHAGGRPVSYSSWQHRYDRRRFALGLDELVTHDLRRTAVTRLAEAGNDIQDICAVSGHSAQTVKVLIDRYIVKTRELSRNAVVRLEEYQSRLRGNTKGNG